MASYALYISFRSNERPFTTKHEPYPKDRFQTDEEAIKWYEGMKEELYDYDVTLLKDDQPFMLPKE